MTFRWNRTARRYRARNPWWKPGRPIFTRRMIARVSANVDRMMDQWEKRLDDGLNWRERDREEAPFVSYMRERMKPIDPTDQRVTEVKIEGTVPVPMFTGLMYVD